jgi:hypothetical protein
MAAPASTSRDATTVEDLAAQLQRDVDASLRELREARLREALAEAVQETLDDATAARAERELAPVVRDMRLRRDVEKAFKRHRRVQHHLATTSLSADALKGHENRLKAILERHFERIQPQVVRAIHREATRITANKVLKAGFVDTELFCADCGESFFWSAGEQYDGDARPALCVPCRAAAVHKAREQARDWHGRFGSGGGGPRAAAQAAGGGARGTLPRRSSTGPVTPAHEAALAAALALVPAAMLAGVPEIRLEVLSADAAKKRRAFRRSTGVVAEGYVEPGAAGVIHINAWTDMFEGAMAGQHDKLVGVAAEIAHEAWHVTASLSDEAGAYGQQLQVLRLNGASTGLIRSVERARDFVAGKKKP